MLFASWVTWLEGVTPQAVGRMSGLPPRHSFRQLARRRKFGDFGGQNTEATPYPSTTAFRRPWGHYGPQTAFSAASPKTLTGKPFLIGPFMVELFTAVGFARSPNLVKVRLRLSPAWRLPTPAHVERTCPSQAGPNPVGGFAASSAAHRLRNMTASMLAHQGLSASPPFRRRTQRQRSKRYRIER